MLDRLLVGEKLAAFFKAISKLGIRTGISANKY